MAVMPRKPSAETLEAFVRRQDAADMADILIELAADHAVVHDRLVRLCELSAKWGELARRRAGYPKPTPTRRSSQSNQSALMATGIQQPNQAVDEAELKQKSIPNHERCGA